MEIAVKMWDVEKVENFQGLTFILAVLRNGNVKRLKVKFSQWNLISDLPNIDPIPRTEHGPVT